MQTVDLKVAKCQLALYNCPFSFLKQENSPLTQVGLVSMYFSGFEE
jgi:hypothetical protein